MNRLFWILILTLLTSFTHAQTVDLKTVRGSVSVNAPVTKLVAFPAGVIDTLDALGVALVGIPSDVQLDYIQQSGSPVGTLFSADLEAIHRLKPDLVIVGTRSAAQYDAVSQVANTIDLSLPSGNHYQAAVARMHQLALLTGKEAQANQVETRLKSLVNEVKTLINPNERVMVVMIMGRSLQMLTANTRIDWFQSELGMNLVSDSSLQLGELAPISYEYILSKNPDWLIVLDRDAAVGISSTSQGMQLMDNPIVKMTHASQSGQMLFLDGVGTLNAVGGVQGIERTLTQLKNKLSDTKGNK